MKGLSLSRRTAWVLLLLFTIAFGFSSSNNLTAFSLNNDKTSGGLGHQSLYQSGVAAQKSAQESALAPNSPTQYVNSDNWAGYFIGSGSGNGYKGIQGDWNVQCFAGSQSNSRQETTWVGLGG